MDYEVNIPGYNIFRRDRKGKQGGGVAAYVKSSVPCVRRNDYEKDNIEALWIELPLRNIKNVLLCVLYRPPDSKTEWSNMFLEMMTNPCNTSLDIIVVGDFNLNLLNGENKKWLHDVESLGLTQVVKLPTRTTECTSTLIDHVYTTNGRRIVNLTVSDITISDHSPILFTWKHASLKIKTNAHKSIEYRNIDKIDICKFNDDLDRQLNMSPGSPNENDPNKVLQAWECTFMGVVSKHAPKKEKRVRKRFQPDWFNMKIT